MTNVEREAVVDLGAITANVAALCEELGITRQTLYRHVDPNGGLRADGLKLLGRRSVEPSPRDATA